MDALPHLEPAGQDRMLTLAECLASRLCHDVAGLAATIAGTLEMALEETPAQSEASGLAMEAAGLLAARVRLYRAAWGGGDMDEDALETLADGLPNRSRLRLAIAPILTEGGLDAPGRRLLLCALLAATSGMPAGGDIGAEPAGGGFSLVMAGRRAAWPDATAASPADLGAAIDQAEPRGLAAPMAALVAAASGWRLHIDGLCLTAQRVAG